MSLKSKLAMCRNMDGTLGLFLADKDGSHYGQRIAVIENENYANLIAAAPELLENLKYLIEYLEASGGDENSSIGFKRAKKIIAKAEGK